MEKHGGSLADNDHIILGNCGSNCNVHLPYHTEKLCYAISHVPPPQRAPNVIKYFRPVNKEGLQNSVKGSI